MSEHRSLVGAIGTKYPIAPRWALYLSMGYWSTYTRIGKGSPVLLPVEDKNPVLA
ncbi:hypothetical protein FIU96_16385 [Marinobacter sp. THAF39]|nr:hypothetical protein FIV08_16475 [Marinobacter sp. THAF197a]QFT52216.1 hypothetical protein FIU96_16385 [Marinobacter sp. THAF39]